MVAAAAAAAAMSNSSAAPVTPRVGCPRRRRQQPQRGRQRHSARAFAGYATLFFATLITHPLDTLRVRISVMHGEASTPR